MHLSNRQIHSRFTDKKLIIIYLVEQTITMINIAKKIIIFNVSPTILLSNIVCCLQEYNIQLVSSTKCINARFNLKELSLILSYQVYINPQKLNKLPNLLLVKYDNTRFLPILITHWLWYHDTNQLKYVFKKVILSRVNNYNNNNNSLNNYQYVKKKTVETVLGKVVLYSHLIITPFPYTKVVAALIYSK